MAPFKYDPIELFREIVRLSNERDMSWRFTKKGDKRPLADIESQKAGRRASRAAKRNARLAELAAAQRAANDAKRPKPGEDVASRMLREMEPGGWYGMGDLMRLAGAERHQRGKVHQVMLRRKWIESARNPAWSGETLNPWEIMAGAEPHPKRLYRLTEKGVELRNVLIGNKQGHDT